MRLVKFGMSELTGQVEPANISPEMRTDDGVLIADAIPDVDLVNMFDAGFDPVRGIIPQCLTDGRAVCTQAAEAHYRQCARKQAKKAKRNDRAKRLAQHTKRIQAEEHRWNKTPTDDEIEGIIREEPALCMGLVRLYNKVMDLSGTPYKGIRG